MAQQRLRRAARDLGRRSALGARSTQTRSAAVAVLVDELQVAVLAIHGTFQPFALQCDPVPLVLPDRVPNLGTLRFSRVVNYTLLVTWNWWTRGLPSKFWILLGSLPGTS